MHKPLKRQNGGLFNALTSPTQKQSDARYTSWFLTSFDRRQLRFSGNGVKVTASLVESLNLKGQSSEGQQTDKILAYLFSVRSNDFFDVLLALDLSSLKDQRFPASIIQVSVTDEIVGVRQTRRNQFMPIRGTRCDLNGRVTKRVNEWKQRLANLIAQLLALFGCIGASRTKGRCEDRRIQRVHNQVVHSSQIFQMILKLQVIITDAEIEFAHRSR